MGLTCKHFEGEEKVSTKLIGESFGRVKFISEITHEEAEAAAKEINKIGKQIMPTGDPKDTPILHAQQLGEWQLCPKCNGEGKIYRDSFNQNTVVIGWQICHVCNGAKILPRPIIK